MMFCMNCGRIFDDPRNVPDFTSEYFGEPVTHYISVCPGCGSDEIQEAVRCRICGEWSTDDICEYCEEEISGLVTDIRGLIGEKTAERDLDLSELITEIAERL